MLYCKDPEDVKDKDYLAKGCEELNNWEREKNYVKLKTLEGVGWSIALWVVCALLEWMASALTMLFVHRVNLKSLIIYKSYSLQYRE